MSTINVSDLIDLIKKVQLETEGEFRQDYHIGFLVGRKELAEELIKILRNHGVWEEDDD